MNGKLKVMPSAGRRYTMRIAVLMALYVIALFVAVRAFRGNHPPTGFAAYALAVAPAVPVVGVFWAMLRRIVEEADEYQRLLLVRQILIASGFALTIATIWGFLENFGMVEHVEAFYITVLWFFGVGIGAFYNRLTMGHAGCC